ncbi:MAG TPA: GDP-mannose 4,6-dehydratase, partial [Burkholderiales bacterium]|nr:GDP-mannose 4,6-dehydratase [Burkholderiales bacterium]
MNPGFWRGKRVFLTGHTGFKGGWLALWLRRLGARVTGFALEPPTVPSLFDLARVGDGMDCITGDIRDLEPLRAAVARARPELVFHLAAQALVRPGYDDPVATYATNMMGTVNVLESLRGGDSVRAAVMVTSDKCYENREWVWGYRENEAMGGFDPYSSSKGCAELVTAAYRRSFFQAGGVAIA